MPLQVTRGVGAVRVGHGDDRAPLRGRVFLRRSASRCRAPRRDARCRRAVADRRLSSRRCAASGSTRSYQGAKIVVADRPGVLFTRAFARPRSLRAKNAARRSSNDCSARRARVPRTACASGSPVFVTPARCLSAPRRLATVRPPNAGGEPASCALRSQLRGPAPRCPARRRNTAAAAAWRAAAYHDDTVVFHVSIVYHGMTCHGFVRLPDGPSNASEHRASRKSGWRGDTRRHARCARSATRT